MKAARHCPYCYAPDAVSQLARFSLPARQQFTDRSAHLQQCQQCQQLFMSIFEEQTNDAWNAYHYYLPQPLQHDLLISATLCGTPTLPTCHCPIHTLITEIDFSQLQTLRDAEADAAS